MAHDLIIHGFKCLQEIDARNSFYHLPHLLLASGLERYMKCYISVVHQGRTGTFPTFKMLKHAGHNLIELHNNICSNYYGGTTRQLIEDERIYLTSDPFLEKCIFTLSTFAGSGRYYNLDVVSEKPKNLINSREEWENLERLAENPTPYSITPELFSTKYYSKVNSIIISKIERMVRALAMQFTLGDHPDKYGSIGSLSIVFSDFRNLADEQLGKIDYRSKAAHK